MFTIENNKQRRDGDEWSATRRCSTTLILGIVCCLFAVDYHPFPTLRASHSLNIILLSTSLKFPFQQQSVRCFSGDDSLSIVSELSFRVFGFLATTQRIILLLTDFGFANHWQKQVQARKNFWSEKYRQNIRLKKKVFEMP